MRTSTLNPNPRLKSKQKPNPRLFAVLVVQIKPQLEKLLNLADDSLTKDTQKPRPSPSFALRHRLCKPRVAGLSWFGLHTGDQADAGLDAATCYHFID